MDVYPQAKTADVALLLEGTFPFVHGGVSSWVYQLIEAMPQYSFAAIFLGGCSEDYADFRYPLPKNLVHLEAHYLFEPKIHRLPPESVGNPQAFHAMRSIHQEFHQPKTAEFSNTTHLLQDTLVEKKTIDRDQFLHSKQSWDYITETYQKRCPEVSFLEYFWSVRNMHAPIWLFSEIICKMPKVKILHSISTGYAGLLATLLHSRFKLPFILTEHGIYTKERRIDLLRNLWLMKDILHQMPELDADYFATMWVEFFENLAHMAYVNANPIISLFDAYHRRQIEDGAPPQRTKIIPNGVDVDKYSHCRKNHIQPSPILCLIGRVVVIKDIKTFIRAIGIAVQQMPTIQGWIVGSESEDPAYATECKNLVSILGLSEHVKFLGIQNTEEILAQTDLLILSSISEGQPLVILESFAAGVPAVVTNVGNCQSLIYGKNAADEALGKSGEVVEIADPQALATVALTLLKDEQLWRQAQATAIARVSKFYTLRALNESYLAIYQEAMDHGRNRV